MLSVSLPIHANILSGDTMDYGQSNTILNQLLKLLPQDPIQPFFIRLGELPYLSYVNWFVPVGDILNITLAWVGAIAIFYIYQFVLRWIKAIQ